MDMVPILNEGYHLLETNTNQIITVTSAQKQDKYLGERAVWHPKTRSLMETRGAMEMST